MLDFLDPSSSTSTAWVGFMTDLALKGIFLLSIAGLLTALLRRASAATRHWVWTVALVAIILLPALSFMLPRWQVALLPAEPVAIMHEAAPLMSVVEATPVDVSQAVSTPLPSQQVQAEAPASTDVPSVATTPEVEVAPVFPEGSPTVGATTVTASGLWATLEELWATTPLTTWLFWGWMLGAGFVFAHMLWGSWGIWWLTRHARPVTDPEALELMEEIGDRLFITRPIHLLKSARTTMPVTWGWTRPVVLLPMDATDWTSERKRCVLTHEMAHIKRYDCLTQTLAQFTCALNWFNPLVWVAAKRLRVEREKACDDFVITTGMKPSNYATHLLELASQMRPTFVSPLGAVAMAKPSQLEGRVVSILDPNKRRRALNRVTGGFCLLLAALVVLPLAALEPVAAEEEPEPEPVLMAVTAPEPEPEPEPEPVADESLYLDDEEPAVAPPPPPPKRVHRPVERERDVRRQYRSKPNRCCNVRSHSRDESSSSYRYRYSYNSNANKARVRIHTSGISNTRITSREDVIRALREALVNEDEDVRLKIVHALGELEDEAAVPVLRRVLSDDESYKVRSLAAWALGEIEAESSVRALIKALEDDNASVREMAAWALGEIESSTAVSALGTVLVNDPAMTVRRKAAWALGEIEDARAVDALGLALTDSDTEVRRKAMWALGEIEDVRAIPALRRAIESDDQQIRKSAAWAMGEIEDARAIEPLSALLADESTEVRKQAAWALGEIEDHRAVPVLMERFKKESSANVREMIVWALGEIEDPRAVDVLGDALEDESQAVRRKAMWALGELEDARSVPALIKALKNSNDASVRKQAAWALGEIEDASALPALVDALKDDNGAVRKQAVWALGEIEDPRAIQGLGETMLSDSKSDVRKMAAWALGEIEDTRSVGALTQALKDESREVRKMAAWALGEIDY